MKILTTGTVSLVALGLLYYIFFLFEDGIQIQYVHRIEGYPHDTTAFTQGFEFKS